MGDESKDDKYEIETDAFIKRHLREMRQQDMSCAALKFDKQFVDAKGRWGSYSRDYGITINVNIEIRTIKNRR